MTWGPNPMLNFLTILILLPDTFLTPSQLLFLPYSYMPLPLPNTVLTLHDMLIYLNVGSM
jgi:hypothetical protein